MNNYETVMIIKPTLDEENKQKTIAKIENYIKKHGEITTEETWGLRKLAYPIQKYSDGYYVLIEFKAEVEAIDNLSKLYHNTEDIIKHIIVKKD